MLIIQRHVGDRIVLPDGVEITVAAITPRGVRLAVQAPRGVLVLRGEVYDAIAKANVAAADTPFADTPLDTVNAERK